MLTLLAALALSPTAEAADVPMQAGARYRYMFVPDGFINPYVFDLAAAPRPEIRAYAVGAEFSLVNPQTQWTFYVERIGIGVEPGFWDDIEEPADHNDGEWVVPSSAFGLIAVGANVGKDVPLTDVEKDVWLDFHVSGGLGVGVVTGDLTRWRAGVNVVDDPVIDTDCMPSSPSYERKDTCEDDGTIKLPPVAPLIDLNLGLQVHFTDHVYLRVEGGLHSILHAGGALGARF